MKKKILITGGTIFVSRYAAYYFVNKGYDVYVLNRGNHEQVPGTTLILGDRSQPLDCLRGHSFDAVLDINSYDRKDVKNLLDHLESFEDYILISTSAVYPETLKQPFREDQKVGPNSLWGSYCTDKIAAEEYLMKHVPNAYILRPPYLYGPMENIYREPFVFDCALSRRKFYIPKDGTMPLQFFHVEDLCRLMEILLRDHPQHHILNVGNEEIVDINRFAELCYEAAGVPFEKVFVRGDHEQHKYFSFADYTYVLDVTLQHELLPVQKDLLTGLKESYEWYLEHQDQVKKRDYMEYIDKHLA